MGHQLPLNKSQMGHRSWFGRLWVSSGQVAALILAHLGYILGCEEGTGALITRGVFRQVWG